MLMFKVANCSINNKLHIRHLFIMYMCVWVDRYLLLTFMYAASN